MVIGLAFALVLYAGANELDILLLLGDATINPDFFSFSLCHSPSLSQNSTGSVNLTLGCGTKGRLLHWFMCAWFHPWTMHDLFFEFSFVLWVENILDLLNGFHVRAVWCVVYVMYCFDQVLVSLDNRIHRGDSWLGNVLVLDKNCVRDLFAAG